MMSAPLVVHYLHSSARIGGGNIVLLRLIDALDRSRFVPVSVVPRPGPLSRQLERRGVAIRHLDLLAAADGLLRGLPALGRLTFHLRRHAPSIVHVNDLLTYGLARRCWTPRPVRWICHVHHPDFDERLVSWAFRVPPVRILTPSRHVAHLLSAALPVDLRYCCDRIVPVMNPVDTEFFHPSSDRRELTERLGCDAQAVQLVTAGAITRHKGQDLFVRTMRALVDQGRHVQGHVIGEVQPGSEAYDESLRALVRELGLASRIRFHGFATDEDMRDLFRIADVFVLPTAEEGFGLVLAEAQACGTPVVSTAMAPLDEVVQHGRTGLLVERSVDAIVGSVAALVDAPERRLAMGQAAREWVAASFSIQTYYRAVARAYEEVVGDRRSAHTSSRSQSGR